MRHGRRADLAGPESLGGQLGPGHQPDRGGQRRRRGGQLHQRGQHVEVERARVDLADAGQPGGEAEVRGHPPLQLGELGRIAAEQVEHVLGGAHRALDAAQRVARAQLLQPGVRDEHLVGRGGEPLAQRGGLRGRRCGCARPCTSSAYSAARRASRASTATERSRTCSQRQPDLQLLDVLGEVAAGQALVHVLVPGERVELLDARLDVVPGDPLAGGDGVQVDPVDHPLVVGDHPVRHVDAQLVLGAQHGQPQPPLEDDLVLGRPQPDQLRARVAGGQYVGDHVG